MSRVFFIDSGPLGYAFTPAVNSEHLRCSQWLEALILNGEQIAIAEIVDYECRRGWLRQENHTALAKLDSAKAAFTYVPITTLAMLQAAEFWAAARKGGYATTTDQRLDADVILAAQASTFTAGGTEVVVATMNVRHLSRFVTAKNWGEIL
jgi:predicted nucleic acid-binding protein